MHRTILAIVAMQAIALAMTATVSAEEPAEGFRSWNDGAWRLVETSNFRVAAIATEDEVRGLARSCESLKGYLCQKWLGEQPVESTKLWTPKCYVVVHPTADSYLREVGPGQQTAGSSFIEIDGKALLTRRIDLRADHPLGYHDALAHEMTHVVVAERFVQRQIPRWADEGMATLADSVSKQSAHLTDFQHAHRRGHAFRLANLFAFENYPRPEQQATFYGQSVSLAKFLVERGSTEQLMRFVEMSQHRGYDAAAREIYNFDGVTAMERAWMSQLSTPQAMAAHDDVHPARGLPIIGRPVAMISR
jgi:hypothetical protein